MSWVWILGSAAVEVATGLALGYWKAAARVVAA
jgi:hypothetical protein